MTYHTLKCPHCKKIVNRATGSPSYIGNPFRKCPWCGGIYVDSFTQEWVTKSPNERIMFLIDKPLAGGFISIFPIAGLLTMAEVNIIASLIIAAICAVTICIVWTFVRKSSIQEMIDQSLERTKSEKYVKLLKKKGFKIYYIDGVEIGTDHNDDDSPLQEEKIEKEHDKSFTLH